MFCLLMDHCKNICSYNRNYQKVSSRLKNIHTYADMNDVLPLIARSSTYDTYGPVF